MRRAISVSLPDFTPDRLVERIAEAMTVARAPDTLKKFPLWTQRVMQILKEQLVPREFAFLLTADQSIFAEGVAVALAAKARDVRLSGNATGGGLFARQLAGRLEMDPTSQEIAAQVEAGTFNAPEALQTQVMQRLFAPDATARLAFIEGLAIGNRLPELLDSQARRGTTDATGIYLILWFYWPEISKLDSIGDVARALAPFFSENKNIAGAHWDERIRKLANRIGLSFRAKQTRRKRVTAG
ncbi:MAG: hypothetical protein V4773_16370 [Verrucomicrobiota bacterium]